MSAMARITRASVKAVRGLTEPSGTRSRSSAAAAAVTNKAMSATPPKPSSRKRKQAPESSSSLTGKRGGRDNFKKAAITNRETIQKLVESNVLHPTNGSKENEEPTTNVPAEGIDTKTLGGWCLVNALVHCSQASDGILAPLILEHGPPEFYLNHLRQKHTLHTSSADQQGYPSFRSLCFTVAGQQLSDKASKTIWRRLVATVVGSSTEDEAPNQEQLVAFTPEAVLSVVEASSKSRESLEARTERLLRKPAGLSNAKCRCILEISRAFRDGSLSEDLLMGNNNDDDDDEIVRTKLLAIKGIGPWTVDMFLMFQLHKPDVLPVLDLGVRNGTAALWKINGKGKPPASDAVSDLHAPFAPYRSISSYYMYKAADAQKEAKKKQAKTKAKK